MLRVALAPRRPARAAPALPHRRARRGSAERIAGYHLTALALMVADPGAEHGRASLLSDQELRFQLDRLAGPPPSCRTAGSTSCSSSACGCTRTPSRPCTATGSGPTGSSTRTPTGWRGALARGLRREGVVAVVTERNLDWMASVIAIFKAGGAYLPIEPRFRPIGSRPRWRGPSARWC